LRTLNWNNAIICVAVLATLLFVSCGGATSPTLVVDQGELGPYNALPLFSWNPTSTASIKEAEYSLDGVTWVPIGPSVREFRPDAPLPAGDYTLQLHTRSWSGWSDLTEVTFTVQEIAGYQPNDTFYAQYQWALPMIDMPLSWSVLDELFPDRGSVVVAVIDTGYLDHPDLVANINEADGFDFIEDTVTANDGDGIDPDAHDAGDDFGDGYGNSWHGTSVAGTIAAVTNNATGVAGVAREKVTIMPLRVLGVGGGWTYDIAQALLYAAGLPNDSGGVPDTTAKIANLSLGGGGSDPYMDEVLEQVTEAGLIVVAATGNSSDDPVWAPVGYPALSPFTIAAGSVGMTSDVAYYSQMGAELDVVAPGGDLSLGGETGVLLPSAESTATYPPNPAEYNYAFIQGTSFACPYVSGALAVLVAIDPTLDLATARDLLRRSGSNLDDPLIPGLFEIGILNMASLMELHFGGRIATSIERPLFSWVRTMVADSQVYPETTSGQGAPPPEAEKDQGSLIVRFANPEEGPAEALARVAGVRSIRGAMGSTRLIELEPAVNLESIRETLLADPAVQAVYYNYRYQPL
jgi:subtilisin family serine protease